MKRAGKPLWLMAVILAIVMAGLAGCTGNGNDHSDSGNAGAANGNEGSAGNAAGNGGSGKAGGDVGFVDTLTVTAFNWGWDAPDPAKDQVLPELTKRLGLKKLEFVTLKVGSYDDVLQKMQLWASTGAADWPHFLTTGADAKAKLIMDNLGEAGKLEDLTPWLEKYPNVKKAVEKLLPFSINEHDGKIYYIPQNFSDLKAYPIDVPTVWIRKDWLDQLQLPYPKTTDEFYETLKKFKSEIKEVNGQPVIPYMAFGESFENMIHVFFPDGMEHWYTDENGKAARGPVEHPEYLINALKFYNKLYREGLIDKESFTLKQGQIDERGNQGRIGALHGAYWQMANPYTDNMKKTNPNAMFVGIPLYDKAAGSGPKEPKFMLVAWSLWAVKAGIPDEEINTFFKALDYVLSEEGTILTKFGIEGVHWERNAEGKIVDTKEFFERTQGDWNKRAHEGIDTYSFIPNYEALVRNMAPTATELREDMILTWENLGTKYPTGFYTDPQAYVTPGDVENKYSLGDSDRYKQMVTNAVTAASPDKIDSIVNEWVQTVKALGYEEIVEERTEAAKKIDLSQLNQ